MHSLVSSFTDSGVHAYLEFLVDGADAEMAYALMIMDKTIVMDAQADPELPKVRTTPTTRPLAT